MLGTIAKFVLQSNGQVASLRQGLRRNVPLLFCSMLAFKEDDQRVQELAHGYIYTSGQSAGLDHLRFQSRVSQVSEPWAQQFLQTYAQYAEATCSKPVLRVGGLTASVQDWCFIKWGAKSHIVQDPCQFSFDQTRGRLVQVLQSDKAKGGSMLLKLKWYTYCTEANAWVPDSLDSINEESPEAIELAGLHVISQEAGIVIRTTSADVAALFSKDMQPNGKDPIKKKRKSVGKTMHKKRKKKKGTMVLPIFC